MNPSFKPSFKPSIVLMVVLGACAAQAQTSAPAAPASAKLTAPTPMQQCAAQEDASRRLACYDGLAGRTTNPGAGTGAASGAGASTAAFASTTPQVSPSLALPTPATPAVVAVNPNPAPPSPADEGCHDRRYSDFSRFWELEKGTDCGTFGLRGYRPLSLSWTTGDSMNDQPTSPSAGHTGTYTAYRPSEMRVQLSVRTKIAQGLLTQGEPDKRDSLWFGYTQQSNWQLFNGTISRPFRSTDHEPELVYVYPLNLTFGNGWKLSYGGAGLVHQSNGQSLPLSRSWNRVYLMAGLEAGDKWRFQARAWRRLPENAAEDDNPDISDYIGRAEVTGWWNVTPDNTLAATVRSSLSNTGRGSVKLEWLSAIGKQPDGRRSGLRFHVQLFSGYGDSLIDYNYKRTVLMVGLSLLDF